MQSTTFSSFSSLGWKEYRVSAPLVVLPVQSDIRVCLSLLTLCREASERKTTFRACADVDTNPGGAVTCGP